MVRKMGLLRIPSKTFRWPWILRALISLKRVIMTKALKISVKCWVGTGLRAESRPLSISNILSPGHKNHRKANYISLSTKITIV